MSSSDSSGMSPQFETVEYAAANGTCVLCNQPIGSTSYRVNGHPACSICAQREQTAQRNSTANYSRALVFGIGAAIVGMIGYATFEIATGWIIGYVSLAVGWLVGKAMLKGSNGMGGRKYQITAALLTYSAVSLAAIPIMFSQLAKQKHTPAQVQQQTAQQPAAPSGQQPSTASPDAHPTITVTPESSQSRTPGENSAESKQAKMGFGKAIGLLVLIGLASPFLELQSPVHGIIGLFILFIGMQIAWKMTGRPKFLIEGPL